MLQPVREELLLGLHMLLLMHNANEKAGRRIQPSEFYNNEISNDLNLQHEYLTWLQLQACVLDGDKYIVFLSLDKRRHSMHP